MTKIDVILRYLRLALPPTTVKMMDADLAALKSRPQKEKPEPVELCLKTGAWLGISTLIRALWVKAYPAVDIDAELAKASGYLIANPAKANRSNFLRFLNSWMRRTQDHGGTRGYVSAVRPATEDRGDAWARTTDD